MKAYGNKRSLSRRDFVATAAVSICGMTATLLSGEKSARADAAQESERRTSSGATTVTNKLIITVSPSGADPHQTSRTDIAKDPKRHADTILESFHAGASVVHIRGASAVEKNPDLLHGHGADLDNWKEVTDLVRSRCNIVINYGSSAMEPRVRKPLLALEPDAASFLSRPPLHGMAVLPDFQRQSALNHLEAGVLPEVEIFHTGDIANLNTLIKTGVLRPPYCVTLFFNYDAYYAVPPTLPLLQGQLGLLPTNARWTICAKGPKHLEMAAHAIALGGHVRTGLENDVELAPGRFAKSQAECVGRIVRLAQELGREVATPDEARQILGLPRRPEKITADGDGPPRLADLTTAKEAA